MGFADAFAKEDRVEITVSQLYVLVKEASRADLFRNGVKNSIPNSHILCVLDGDDSALKSNDNKEKRNEQTEGNQR